jgi:hypothetical protein
VVGGGTAIASCATSESQNAVTTVTPVGAVSPSLQVPMLDSASCNSWLSADGGSLIETHVLGGPGGSPVRITDLRSGAAHDVVLPPGVFDDGAREQFTAALDVAVTRTSTSPQPPTVLAATGGSVYRLTARPRFLGDEQIDAPMQRSLSADDGPFVLGHIGDALVVDDKRTGQRVNRLPGVVVPGSRLSYGSSDIWVVSPEPHAWRLTRYAVPDLRRITSFPLPVSADPAPTSLEPFDGQGSTFESVETPDGERILSLSDGVLALLDPGSGRPLYPPVTLGDSPEERRWYQLEPLMRVRPGHPGQAVVTSIDGELEVWDAVRGERLTTIPTTHRPLEETFDWSPPIAMDADGSRLALLTPDHSIEVRDVDSAALLGPPIPAPGAVDLPGFDADGHLVVLADQTSIEQELRFIDVDERRETGTLTTGSTFTRGVLGPDGRALWYVGIRGASPYLLPLTAGAWRDALCPMLDRPFTESESRVLPPGADTEGPCS